MAVICGDIRSRLPSSGATVQWMNATAPGFRGDAAPEELNNERLCRVKRPGPVRIAQLVVGALAVAGLH